MNKPVIVMPVYNNFSYTKQVMDEISKYTHIDYDFVIVDNASTDITEVELSHITSDGFKYVRSTSNLGVTRAWNVGIDEFREASYFCILNNDILLQDNWLSKLIEIMERDTNVGVISPFPLDTAHCTSETFQEIASKYTEEYKEGVDDGLHGCCYIIRKEVFDKIGLFDEQFYMMCSDFDICKRIEDAGYEARVVHSIVIYHFGGRTQDLFNSVEREGYFKRDLFKYFDKHGWPKKKFTLNSGKMRYL